MKKRIFFAVTIAAFAIGGIVWAADHIDAPAVTGQSTDITDLYVFRGQDANNLVFVANTQGLLTPGTTAAAKFDENTLIEFNIDNNADNVEDLVIQCIVKDGKMKVYGPVKPSSVGNSSKIEGSLTVETSVTSYSDGSPKIGNSNGVKVFAGPRDDPFFFDLTQYQKIIGGTASGFNNPGTDTFAGTNVLSVVVEVPKSMLGSSASINVWAEAKKKV